jgi:NADH dehydrogenase
MTELPRRVIVLGAGYAGLLATTRLAGRLRREIEGGQVAVTLVNAADVFVERLRLHQLAANHEVAQRPIAKLLEGSGVAFVRGIATHLDVARQSVGMQTDAGVQSLSYDELVYALGSTIERDSSRGQTNCPSRACRHTNIAPADMSSG